jgi:hypothetical protein
MESGDIEYPSMERSVGTCVKNKSLNVFPRCLEAYFGELFHNGH